MNIKKMIIKMFKLEEYEEYGEMPQKIIIKFVDSIANGYYAQKFIYYTGEDALIIAAQEFIDFYSRGFVCTLSAEFNENEIYKLGFCLPNAIYFYEIQGARNIAEKEVK